MNTPLRPGWYPLGLHVRKSRNLTRKLARAFVIGVAIALTALTAVTAQAQPGGDCHKLITLRDADHQPWNTTEWCHYPATPNHPSCSTTQECNVHIGYCHYTDNTCG